MNSVKDEILEGPRRAWSRGAAERATVEFGPVVGVGSPGHALWAELEITVGATHPYSWSPPGRRLGARRHTRRL